MNKGYKYRLLPNKHQEKLLKDHFFVVNQAYNIILSLNKSEFETNKTRKENQLKPEYLKEVEIDNKVKQVLKERGLSFNTKLLQQERVRFKQNLKSQIKKISNGNKDIGNLKYKKYSRFNYQSFQTTKEQFKLLNHSNPKYKILKLFKEEIKFRYTRNLPNYSSITISFDGDKYYIVFNVIEDNLNNINNLNLSSSNDKLGLDFNIKSIDLGNKNFYKKFNINQFKDKTSLNNKLKKLERKQSKRIDKLIKLNKGKDKEDKIKQSKNYFKTKKKINKINKKIINQRNFRLHKLTNDIIKTIFDNGFNNLIVEDLSIKNMTKKTNKNNFVKEIGIKKTKQMKKNILDISPSLFFQILEYKCVQFGIKFEKTDPKYTSKTCSNCGNIHNNLNVTIRKYKCTECNFEIDRDRNASINISKKR